MIFGSYNRLGSGSLSALTAPERPGGSLFQTNLGTSNANRVIRVITSIGAFKQVVAQVTALETPLSTHTHTLQNLPSVWRQACGAIASREGARIRWLGFED